MRKRLFRVLLALALVMTLVPAAAVTAFGYSCYPDGKCGDNLTWTVDADGTLTISGTGDMWDLEMGEAWGNRWEDITRAVIGPGVTSIGNYAFSYSSRMTDVELPASLTRIGKYAFDNCRALASVTLGDKVKTLGDLAFTNCSALEEVILPASVTDIGNGVFSGCSSLRTFRVAADNPNYSSDGKALFNKEGTVLKSYVAQVNTTYVVPDGVTSIGSAFARCSALEEVTLPASVTSIPGYAFQMCGSLKRVNLPAGLTDIGMYAFYYCKNLEIVDFPASLTDIGQGAFEGCYPGLKKLIFRGPAPTVDSGAFRGIASTLYYPAGDATWEPWVDTNLGAGTLTWAAYSPLSAPTVTGSVGSSGKPALTWNAVDGATGYAIYRANTSGGTYVRMFTTANTSYTNTSAKPGYIYYYKVRALDENGIEGTPGSPVSVRAKLPAPTITSASGQNATGKPTLKWNAVTGAVKYAVYRSGTSTGTFTKLSDAITAATYTDTTANAGYTYYYKVFAIDSKGYWSAASAVIGVHARPVAPVVTGSNAASGKPTLTWSAVPAAAKYSIYRSTDGDSSYSYYDSTTKTTYTNSSTEVGKTYYYKVYAVDGKGFGSVASNAVSVRCRPAAPVVTASTGSSGKPYLSWKAVAGASEYVVYRASSKDGSYTKMFTTSNTSYTNTSAKAGYTYWYKVYAVDAGGYWSLPCDPVSAKATK